MCQGNTDASSWEKLYKQEEWTDKYGGSEGTHF